MLKNAVYVLALLLCLTANRAYAAPKPPPQTQPAPVFSFPSAVRPGAAVDVKFFEEGLGDPIGLWCHFPATVAAAGHGSNFSGTSKLGEARYKITVAENVPVGIYGARLLTSAGASHLRLLMVDDLPTVVNRGGNTTPALAMDVSPSTAIDARCTALAADYYRLVAKRGQRLSAEVVAQRLGSPLDPMIRLLNPSGREIAYCDDAPGIGADCRFSFVFPADGDYLIEVRDVNYDGGRAYFYRLRLGDFPLVTSVSPLGGRQGSTTAFNIEGAAAEMLGDVSIPVPGDRSRGWVNAKYPHGAGSGFVPVLCSDLDERVETKPDDTPSAANKISVPSAITGHFDKPGQPAYFELQASEGEQLAIRGQTRALGSRAVLSLQLLDADGMKIAESKADGPDDAALSASVPATGIYRIVARELAGGAGPGMFYRLEIREVKPGFSLAVDTDVVNGDAGQSFKISVTASRRNFTGPITLSLTGDASGFEFKPTMIAAGKNEVELEVKIPAGFASSAPLTFGIAGKTTIGNGEVIARASTLAALKKLFPRMAAPPPELDGLIGLGVK